MISFILCLIVAITILVVFRLFERFGIDNLQAIVFSYLISAFAAFLIVDWEVSIAKIPQQDWFIYTFIIGASFFIGFNIFALSTQKVGMALTSVAANISVIIPVGMALILYDEKLNIWQIGGLTLALVAIFLVFKPTNKTKVFSSALIFPLALFFINGINNSLMKHVEHLDAMSNPMLFLGLVFTVSFGIGLTFYLLKKNKKPITRKNLLAALILGLLNFISTYLFLASLTIFDSSVFFPIFNLSFIGGSAIIGVFVFKEKLRPINWLGLILAIFAIVLITYFQ
ncbi:MAG: hypothetical protein DRI84_05225 [Bacteroidetes bacterium]|nr:MAG: hypothetical protein DRI84_05225 [Bacteroidota bacterium]